MNDQPKDLGRAASQDAAVSNGAEHAAASAAWEAHYDELAQEGNFVLFDLEARDYVERLQASLPLEPGMRVLDFGCGFGAVSERLAGLGVELRYFDRAASMRAFVERRLQGYDNARLTDPATTEERFDLVIINSVVQYMSPEELQQALAHWRGLLAPGGRVMVSDIIPPESHFLGEVFESLRFSAANGVLVTSIFRLVQEFIRYSKRRSSLVLLRLDRDRVREMAAAAGLNAEFLAGNLTFRRHRLTVALTAAS